MVELWSGAALDGLGITSRCSQLSHIFACKAPGEAGGLKASCFDLPEAWGFFFGTVFGRSCSRGGLPRPPRCRNGLARGAASRPGTCRLGARPLGDVWLGRCALPLFVGAQPPEAKPASDRGDLPSPSVRDDRQPGPGSRSPSRPPSGGAAFVLGRGFRLARRPASDPPKGDDDFRGRCENRTRMRGKSIFYRC